MSTLCESSLPLLLLGGVVTVGCVVGWLKTADRRLWIGAVLGIVAAVSGIVLERMVVTDREQIERVIFAVAADVRAGRTEAAVQHIRPDDEDLRNRARTELKLYQVTEINIKRPIEITVSPDREPTKGKAEFNVVVKGGDVAGFIQDQQVPRYLIVRFVKIDGRWYASDYEHHDPLHGMRRHDEGESKAD